MYMRGWKQIKIIAIFCISMTEPHECPVRSNFLVVDFEEKKTEIVCNNLRREGEDSEHELWMMAVIIIANENFRFRLEYDVIVRVQKRPFKQDRLTKKPGERKDALSLFFDRTKFNRKFNKNMKKKEQMENVITSFIQSEGRMTSPWYVSICNGIKHKLTWSELKLQGI